MKLGIRAVLILSGTALLYLGLVARTPHSVLSLVLVLLTALMVFAAGWRLATPTTALACGMASVVFFLLNPAVVRLGLTTTPGQSPLPAFFAMAFLCTWLWIEHWSVFMRSLLLTLLFALGLSTGAGSTFWIFYAMIPWVVFNRRPAMAVGMFISVWVGGWLLYGASWIFACLIFRHAAAVMQPVRELLLQMQTVWPGNTSAGALTGDEILGHWLGNLRMISLPWATLSLWAAAERFHMMIRDRRSDISSFAAALVGVAAVVSLYEAACGDVPAPGLLAAWVAFSAPLVARECVQRELLFTRSARFSSGIALGLGLAVAIFWGPRPTLWGPGVVMVVAYLISSGLPATRRLIRSARARAVFVGALLAAYAEANYFLWRG